MKEEDYKTIKTVNVFKLVANDVAAIFPYFLVFYLISLMVSIFFSTWRGYFYWPAFHASVIALALISLGSGQVRTFWNGVMDASQQRRSAGFGAVGRGAMIVRRGAVLLKKNGFEVASRGVMKIGRGILFLGKFLAVIFCAMAVPAWKKILFWKMNLGKAGYYKLAAILVVLAFSLFQGMYVLDFFVLLFGLVSVLFGLDMRISGGCALVLLAACPILLAFNQNVLAEAVAVYAYYFLVIAVFTGIGDHMRENNGFLKVG